DHASHLVSSKSLKITLIFLFSFLSLVEIFSYFLAVTSSKDEWQDIELGTRKGNADLMLIHQRFIETRRDDPNTLWRLAIDGVPSILIDDFRKLNPTLRKDLTIKSALHKSTDVYEFFYMGTVVVHYLPMHSQQQLVRQMRLLC
ncbi:hypothetical protein Pfo_011545, partial [Paulownia fortunei]